MGLASLGTNQFFQRFLMFFMQPSKFPKEPHTQYMEPKRMHYFTLIQIFLFMCLLVFRSISAIAIAFPIIIKLCIPVRMYLLPRWFSTEELIMIDTDDETVQAYLAYKENKEGGGKKMMKMEEGEEDAPAAEPYDDDEDV